MIWFLHVYLRGPAQWAFPYRAHFLAVLWSVGYTRMVPPRVFFGSQVDLYWLMRVALVHQLR